MQKFRKYIISVIFALVFIVSTILPVAALDEAETESTDIHNELCNNEVDNNAVALDIGCLFGQHDYKYYYQFQAEGELYYGPDIDHCFIKKEKWTVIDKCTKCGALRELTAPGAIISSQNHIPRFVSATISGDGKFRLTTYVCRLCGHYIYVSETLN